MAKRRCTGKTKKGKRCKAAPLKGGKYCSAHDPQVPVADRFGSPEQSARAGAMSSTHVPSVTEVMRARVEAHVDEVLAPYFKALGVDYVDGKAIIGTGAVIVGRTKEGDVIPSDVEDLAGQVAAAERLLDRVYGKPKHTAELSGPDGGPIRLDDSVDLSKLDEGQLVALQKLMEHATPDR